MNQPNDYVLIQKPENIMSGPGWDPLMNQYDNTIQRIRAIYDNGDVIMHGCMAPWRDCWYFGGSWLTGVSPPDADSD